MNRVLILAPHADDGEFGCGGSIDRFVDEGKEVFYVAFSMCEESIPEPYPKDILRNEVKEATKRLGIPKGNVILYNFRVRELSYHRQEILEELMKLREAIRPDLIFVPSPNDLHQDHSTVSIEGIRAFKKATILGYEICWNNIEFKSQNFIILSEENIETKIHAIDAYDSQKGRGYLGEDFIRSLATTRGYQIGQRYAETFETIRWIL